MRDIIVTIVIFGLVPISLMRPWLGVLVWYWLGMMNPHKLTWGFATTMPFAAAIGGALLLGTLFAKDRRPVPWNMQLVISLVFLAYVTFTTFFAWEPSHAWAQWDKVMKVILMTIVATMFIYGKERIHALLMVLALSIGFYGFKGGIFTLLGGGANRVEGPAGTFIAGNTFLGLALVMVTPLLIILARQEQRPWLKKTLFAVAMLSILSAIFTYSRGALIGLAVTLPLLFMKSNKKFLVLVLLIPLIIFGKDLVPEKLYKRAETIETYQEDNSAMQRVRAWGVAWNIAKARPFTGAGFEFEYSPNEERWFSYMNPEYMQYGNKTHAAHSIYFQVLGQHGFVAFGLFMLLLVSSIMSFYRLSKQARLRPETAWMSDYATAVQLGLFGYMASGAFLSSAYFDLMYIFVALTAILSREMAAANEKTSLRIPMAKRRKVRLPADESIAEKPAS